MCKFIHTKMQPARNGFYFAATTRKFAIQKQIIIKYKL